MMRQWKLGLGVPVRKWKGLEIIVTDRTRLVETYSAEPGAFHQLRLRTGRLMLGDIFHQPLESQRK